MSSAPSVPGGPDAAQVNQKRGQAILVWAAGALCIYGWDWILCLPQEYQRIWKKNFTPISILYLVNRYFGILQFSVVLSLMTDVWSSATCQYMFYWDPATALVSTVLSQMILGVRVYAFYAQSRVIAILLLSILLVEVCLGGIAVSLTSAPVPGPPGINVPCVAVPPPLGWMVTFWSIPLFYDTLTFILTARKMFGFWRKEVNTPLVAVIWRDGMFYFFAICTMNFINVLIFVIAPNSLTWVVNLTPTLMFTVILSSRLVLNLRNTHVTAASLPDSNGVPASNSSKIRSDLKHHRGTSANQPYIPKSEWIELSSPTRVKLESVPGRDRIEDYPIGIV